MHQPRSVNWIAYSTRAFTPFLVAFVGVCSIQCSDADSDERAPPFSGDRGGSGPSDGVGVANPGSTGNTTGGRDEGAGGSPSGLGGSGLVPGRGGNTSNGFAGSGLGLAGTGLGLAGAGLGLAGSGLGLGGSAFGVSGSFSSGASFSRGGTGF